MPFWQIWQNDLLGENLDCPPKQFSQMICPDPLGLETGCNQVNFRECISKLYIKTWTERGKNPVAVDLNK